ncbi:MAG: hypothetical protein AAAC47_01610 [Pararhizobium sp.]
MGAFYDGDGLTEGVPRKAVAEYLEQRFGQADDPSDEQQEDKPRNQGQRHSEKPRVRLPLGRKFANQN